MNNFPDLKDIVTFVTCHETGNAGIYNCTFYYDDVHIDFTLRLIDKLSTIKKYNFIIKCLKAHPFPKFSEITKDWISKKHYSNIIYKDDKLIDNLRLSCKAIITIPSSAILESEKTKVDTLVLYHHGCKVREKAETFFKYIKLRKFSDINDGINAVEKFLLED